MNILQVGYAEADVTPPAGAIMAAFPAQPPHTPRIAEGARDPLRVHALALSDGAHSLCICSADVVTWQRPDVDAVRDAVAAARPDIARDAILLTATHTHAALENTYLFGGTPDLPEVERLRTETVRIIAAALDNARPATAAFGAVSAPFNFNRRIMDEQGRSQLIAEYAVGVTEGVTDPRLSVLRFDRDDGRVLLWAHWTAHALTLGAANRRFSADYPGAVADRAVELWPEESDLRVIFTNGCAGNVHPLRCMRGDDEAIDWLTEALAPQVITAAQTARPLSVKRLDLTTTRLTFPNRADAALAADPQNPTEARLACLRLTPAGGENAVVIGFFPGEPYVEFGLAFREALPTAETILIGYADGWVGYVPTRAAFAEGGYGVDFHPTDPPRFSRTQVPEGAGEAMLEALLNMARSGAAS